MTDIMNPEFEIKQLLTIEDCVELIKYRVTCETLEAHQDYNLFDVSKTIIHNEHLGEYTKAEPKALAAINKLQAEATRRGVGRMWTKYFLYYGEDGFTRHHTDDDANVGLTMVTLIDQKNLEGGETVLLKPYLAKARPEYKYAKRDDDKQGPYGQRIVPEVVPMEVCDTIIYDRYLMHGVAKVRKGYRLVLVNWFEPAL
jgi:hypothetical protein